jgi:hypothetical protein
MYEERSKDYTLKCGESACSKLGSLDLLFVSIAHPIRLAQIQVSAVRLRDCCVLPPKNIMFLNSKNHSCIKYHTKVKELTPSELSDWPARV